MEQTGGMVTKMKIFLIGLVMVLIPSAVFALAYPLSQDVQRISPERCPLDVTPITNLQGASGNGGPPVAVSTHAEVISGLGTRQSYTFISDGDFCANYGSTLNGAPATEPVGAAPCTDGVLFKANTLYVEYVFPGNRMDAACVTGTCNISTTECDP
jgi:hypothetical protein